MQPILLRRSLRTPSGLPEFIGKGRDVGMAECGNAMTDGRRQSMPMSLLGVFQGFPRILMSGRVILFSLLPGGAMRVRGNVV
jgi:hypothetical protein